MNLMNELRSHIYFVRYGRAYFSVTIYLRTSTDEFIRKQCFCHLNVVSLLCLSILRLTANCERIFTMNGFMSRYFTRAYVSQAKQTIISSFKLIATNAILFAKYSEIVTTLTSIAWDFPTSANRVINRLNTCWHHTDSKSSKLDEKKTTTTTTK